MNRCLIIGDCDLFMLHCGHNKSIKRKKKGEVDVPNNVFHKYPADLLKIQKGPNSIFVFLIFLIFSFPNHGNFFLSYLVNFAFKIYSH